MARKRKKVSKAKCTTVAHWYRDLAGHTVGDYRLEKFIGSGRIGFVYRATHKEISDVERAVKLIFDTLREGWTVELQKVMKLALVHGVVHFHEVGTAQVSHDRTTHLCQYTVWDFIPPGENLREYLVRVGRVDTSFLVAVVERILHVLVACEENGVTRHGDLHSGNILIGNPSDATLDESLERRAPIYVSDFGYGATGARTEPKDDYVGVRQIINEVIPCVDYSRATATDRKILQSMQQGLGKLLGESVGSERQRPLVLLEELRNIKFQAQTDDTALKSGDSLSREQGDSTTARETPSVGQFQVSEMIGDRWTWWRELFVPTVPARSKILALDIPTVVTGPRGCGKTMLFRRLSERLIVECGPVENGTALEGYAALYVNANDFADAFSHFPNEPTQEDEGLLICYANLCVLGELLAVESARAGRLSKPATDKLLQTVARLLLPESYLALVEGQDRLERCRAVLEQVKWLFPEQINADNLPGFFEMRQHRWLPQFVRQAREFCKWLHHRSLLLFIDDYSMPRVTSSMQRVLNRLFLQRSSDFLAKLATEAPSSFVSEESSGKSLQDGDDYQLVDMGEEALFLTEGERLSFLSDIFVRRLRLDDRIPVNATSLQALLGQMPLSKTEFARRLRERPGVGTEEASADQLGSSQRRGRSRARVNYYGANVFCDLWSGDTRTMIQLVTDVVDQASEDTPKTSTGQTFHVPIRTDLQDRVFRNRGGEWLDSHTRNEPSNPDVIKKEIERLQQKDAPYALSGGYGEHLKAVVEAFVSAARHLLLGRTYIIREGKTSREVPRMAFRLEVTDHFRIDGLAREIYRDLVRYGLFMRDSRGKSVQGTFVPRLYLRRLLLPYCALALSKRDSVSVSCEMFIQLLLRPDQFGKSFAKRGQRDETSSAQEILPFAADEHEPEYDDLSGVSNTASDSSG